MGGEHWKSDTGEKVRKSKDAYVRFIYPEQPKQLRTIVGKKELRRDKELFDFVDKWALAKPKPVGCVWCGKVDTTELVTSPYIYTVEMYNWEKPKTEMEFEVHRECVKTSTVGIRIESLKMLGKNPTFSLVRNHNRQEAAGRSQVRPADGRGRLSRRRRNQEGARAYTIPQEKRLH